MPGHTVVAVATVAVFRVPLESLLEALAPLGVSDAGLLDGSGQHALRS
jgi:hypothetical protein